jgi:hypothetical protein
MQFVQYRLSQKSANLKYFLVLTGILRFKPARQSVEWYRSIVRRALNMENLISNSFVNSVSNKEISSVS